MLASTFPLAASNGPIARPVLRVTAASAIADVLRDEIVSMVMVPGTPLVEKELTVRFGVSRTPVREALIRLGEDGLVDIRPQSGTFVARIPLQSVAEAVLVRQALEDVVVERAAQRAIERGTAGLDEILTRQAAWARAGDERAFYESDEAFHEAIAELADHPGIWRIVRGCKLQVDRARRLTLPVPGRMDQIVGEHRSVLAAISAGDAQTSREAMRRHLGVMVPDARALADKHPGFFV